MKKRALLIGVSSLLLSGAIAFSCIALGSGNSFSNNSIDADGSYYLTIEGGDLTTSTTPASGDVDLITDSTKEKAPAEQNKVKIDFGNVSYYENTETSYKCNKLTDDKSWFANDIDSPIRSMSKLYLEGVGNVIVSWGWLNENDEVEYYDYEVLNIMGGDYTTFKDYKVNYFKIGGVPYGPTQIEQVVISYDLSCTLAPNPYFVDEDGLFYRNYGEDEAECLGFRDTEDDDLVIPNTANGRTVTVIGEDAFSDTDIKSVTIPNTVKDLGNGCFYSCDYLETVTFEPGNEPLRMGDHPFGGVNSLPSEFVIPKRAANHLTQYSMDDMYNIATFRFEDNYSEGDFYCEDGVIYHKHYDGLELFTYPRKSTRTSFTVPSDVARFNEHVGISNATYLQTLIFENTSALKLGSYTVARNPALTDVQFNGSGAVTIHFHTFANTPLLRTLVLPENIVADSQAFAQIGETEETSVNIFYENDNVDTWNASDIGDGQWYKNKGEYVNVYLMSDYKIPEGDLPEGVSGSWRYVNDVPTIYE